ncbi:hypothetical protein Tco_0593469 [Tanacetum coccineum]
MLWIQDGQLTYKLRNHDSGWGEREGGGGGGWEPRNAEIQNRNQAFNAGNRNDESNQIVQLRDAKYFREQILLAMKDEAGSNLNDEENDFMLDNSFRDETLEELTAAVNQYGAEFQPTDDNVCQRPNMNAKAC